MKAVMKSVSPRICEKVANGDCAVLVSKTAPKCGVPFKGYIYCTTAKPYLYRVDDDNNFELTNTLRPKVDGYVKDYNEQNGKIIGEFVCDKIERIEPRYTCYNPYSGEYDGLYFEGYFIDAETLDKIGLTEEELCDYGDGEVLYAWYVSDLKIYDRPKKLSDFLKPCPDPFHYCTICKHCVKVIPPDEEEYALYHGGHYDYCEEHCTNRLTTPPKGWQYIEEEE